MLSAKLPLTLSPTHAFLCKLFSPCCLDDLTVALRRGNGDLHSLGDMRFKLPSGIAAALRARSLKPY